MTITAKSRHRRARVLMAFVSGLGLPRRTPRCSYGSPDKATRNRAVVRTSQRVHGASPSTAAEGSPVDAHWHAVSRDGLAPEIGTWPAGLRDRPGRACDHRGVVVGGSLSGPPLFVLSE